MTTRRTLARRSLAGLAVATLAMAGFASAASATPGPGQVGAPSVGSLSIHKHAGTETSQTPPNGQQQTVNRPTLAGVTFTICQADGVDLTTDAGWVAAKAATPATVTCKAGTTKDLVTGTTGLAQFNGLPLGLYLVKETAAPANVTKAADFLVTIPYPSATGDATSWLYDVHVYPKNGLTGTGSKTVADPTAHGLGSTVPWTVTTRPIGSFNGGAPLTSYKIVDQLVPQLEYTGTTSLSYLTPGGTLTAVDATDFTVAPAPNGSPGGTVTVTFEDLDWVNSLPAGTTFQWVLTTEVVGVGNLENKAFENTGGENVEIGKATTQWGPVKLLKHDKAGVANPLLGAEFQVYAGACPAVSTPLVGSAVAVSGVDTFASGTDGVVNIAGLYVGKNNAPATAEYCVVETKAPAGYVLPANPRTTVTVTAETTATTTVNIANTPTTGPSLPLTGSGGTLVMTIAGLALVGAGVGTVLVTRKGRRHETV